MSAFAGVRGTGNWGTDERPKNFREAILWANPNGTAPLTALLARARSEKTDDPEFSWWEEKQQIVRVQINYSTGYSDSATTLVIAADGLRLVPGDLLLVEKTETTTYDNELLEVSSVTSGTEIVVKRGAANTTAAAIANGVYLTKIGNVFGEGTGKPDISQANPTKLYNYTEIFKTACGITGTAAITRARTGDAFKNDKKRKMFDHSAALEFAFLFGRRYEGVGTNGKPKRYTGGLRSFLTTNVTIFTTTPTEDTFLNAIYRVFDYNKDSQAGDERLILAGNGFLNSLNKLARNSSSTRVNFTEVIKLYGMNLQRWVTPQGTFAVKTHPLMNQHGRFANSAFIIDPTNLVYRYARDTFFWDKTQNPGDDEHTAMWFTEAGLEVHHEYTMAYIGNFVV